MKSKILISTLNIITSDEEIEVLQKIQNALNCSFTISKEDEDLNKSWSADGYGFFTYLSYSHHRLHPEYLYLLNIITQSNLRPDDNNPEIVFLDFHFQRLLLNNGFSYVMTNEQYGKFLDELEGE